MADFDWSWPSKIEREVIERTLTLDILSEARNLVLVGRNGLGKTMIAQNICHQAVLAGHSVLFRSAAALLAKLHRQTPGGRRRKFRTYANVGLLCIDELGYLNLKPEQSNTFFKLMEERYHRHSTIITTNLGYDEWHNFLGNKSMVEALLSRVRHYCNTVTIDGPSLRDPQG